MNSINRGIGYALLALLLTFDLPAVHAEQDSADSGVAALSNGYALLYQTVKKIDRLVKVLYVKLESDAVDKQATAIGEHASQALTSLEEYAETHPGIDLSDAGLPKVERERRSNTTLTLIKDLATRSGTEFERLFLLAMTNVLNQSRHTAQALAELDQDQAGKQLAGKLRKRFDQDYKAVGELMDARYFCGAAED